MTDQPVIRAANGRPFAAFPVAGPAIIVNLEEQILLLAGARRGRAGVWQTVSGAPTHLWMLHRAINFYRLWRDGPERPLPPELEETNATFK